MSSSEGEAVLLGRAIDLGAPLFDSPPKFLGGPSVERPRELKETLHTRGREPQEIRESSSFCPEFVFGAVF